MHPRLREAEPADLQVLREMESEYYAFDGLSVEAGVATRALSDLLANPSLGRVWLIFDGDLPAGYLILGFGYSIEFGGRDAFVDEFYLREPYRGRGWGKFAISFAADAALELGVHALHLEVTRENARAYRLYESVGFADHDRFLMTKPL